MKEIGGYIELETNSGHEYHEDALALNCGRNCLAYLIRAKHIKKICLPRYICDCVADVCRENQVEIIWYTISDNFLPTFTECLREDVFFYFVNYYGQISNRVISDLAQKHTQFIVDNSQAFYQQPIPGIDTIYTARKFFGVPDGAYLYTDVHLKEDIRRDCSADRVLHLAGRFESGGAAFFKEYQKNEEKFYGLQIGKMSLLTHNMLRGVDYDKAALRRTANYKFLQSKLSSLNQLQCTIPEGAFMYPFLTPRNSGKRIRKKLLESKIYIPTLWPNVLQQCLPDSTEHYFAQDILPLPVDQRYDNEDMEYIAEQLLRATQG